METFEPMDAFESVETIKPMEGAPAASLPAEENALAQTGESVERSESVEGAGAAEAGISAETPDAAQAEGVEAPVGYSLEADQLVVDAEQLMQVASGENVGPSDGIEILVRLAQKCEIDPKAVDIIDVTDKFLKLIAAAPKENLR